MLADMSLVHLACSGAHSSSSDLGSLAIASNLFAQLVRSIFFFQCGCILLGRRLKRAGLVSNNISLAGKEQDIAQHYPYCQHQSCMKKYNSRITKVIPYVIYLIFFLFLNAHQDETSRVGWVIVNSKITSIITAPAADIS